MQTLQKIESAPINAYKETLNGERLPDFMNRIIDAINNLIQNGTNNASLINNVYEVADIAARDAIASPTTGSIAIITDADGGGNPGISAYTGAAWTAPVVVVGGLGDVKLQGLAIAGTTLTATLSNAATIDVDLQDLQNGVSEVADIAARNAIVSPNTGAIAFIADADGSGNPGISAYNGAAWTAPLVVTPGGGGSGASDSRYDAGAGVLVRADGVGVSAVKAAGVVTITTPSTVNLKSFRFVGGAADLNSGELRIVLIGGKGSGTDFNSSDADLYHPDLTIQNRTVVLPSDPFLQRPDDAADSITLFDERFQNAGEVSCKITGLSGDFGIKATL